MRVKGARYAEAQTAFQSAIKADPKYVNPYEQLAFVFAHQQKWQDAADASQHAIALDPVEFPGSFWCNAVANFNLNKHADAEKSIRALLKLDTQHRYPGAEKMMGQFLIDQGNVQEAATHIKAYLAEAPNAPDSEGLRRWLGKVDQASAATPAQAVPATH
jgi:tetratricopeptide (TPR) repeat protein